MSTAPARALGRGPRHRVILLLAALCLSTVVACRKAEPSRPGTALSGPEIADRGRRATGIVTSGTCRGSGFFVAPTLFVTNAHVLCAEAADIRIGDAVVQARFETIDDELDVALLRTDDTLASVTPLPLANTVGLREGDMLTAVGAPADAGDQVIAVSGPVTRPLTGVWGVLHVEADLPLSPGNSGGPLLDDRGRVVAVVSKRRVLRGRRWALGVPIDYIAGWLPAGLAGAARNPDWAARVTEAAQAAAPEIERFRGALERPILIGAHYLPMAAGPGRPEREVLVFVVAAPAAAAERQGLSEATVRFTCGDTRSVTARLSPWVAVDQPLERSMRIDVTPLRPFLAWARKRDDASGLVLATGDASALGAPVECPGRRLALLDGPAETDSIVIE
jgi:S1-C subfamily serine protease